jgi:hypothetical protein
MAESPTEDEQPKRWPSWRVRVALYIVAALAAADLAATAVTGLMLRGEVGKLRVGGYLPSIAQIVPHVPSGQANAADVYLLAFGARQLRDSEEADLVTRRPGRWRPVELLHARQVLAANAEHFRILEQASRIPGCAFPVDWDAGPAMMLRHLPEVQRSARLLSTRAAIAASDRRIDDALADCATMLRMAEHMKCEPTLTSQLSAFAIQDIAVQSMRDALSVGAPSPKAARELFGQLSAVDDGKPFSRALRSEVELFGMKIFDMAQHANSREFQGLLGDARRAAWQGQVLRAYGTIARPLANLDEIAYLRAMKSGIDAISQPWPQSRERLDAVGQSVYDLPAYRSLLTRMLFNLSDRILESRESRTAALRAARIGLALVIYKSERGSYPDALASLEDAGPKIPADPFTGKPFRYARRGDGFIVYSLGPDMQDQGGRPATTYAPHLRRGETRELAQEYDIPFRLPR